MTEKHATLTSKDYFEAFGEIGYKWYTLSYSFPKCCALSILELEDELYEAGNRLRALGALDYCPNLIPFLTGFKARRKQLLALAERS